VKFEIAINYSTIPRGVPPKFFGRGAQPEHWNPCPISDLIMYMKKLLSSDLLRTVQFKCNTSAKCGTPVQITDGNSGL